MARQGRIALEFYREMISNPLIKDKAKPRLADDGYLADLRASTQEIAERLRRMTPAEIHAAVALTYTAPHEEEEGPAPNPAPPRTDFRAPMRSLVGAELARIVERFAAADRRAYVAGIHERAGDREAALAERDEAAGDYYGAESALADVALLLFRAALQHQADALNRYVAAAIRPQLDELAVAVARLEGRR